MTTPPICCTGVPVALPDGRLEYKCGHVYSVVLRLCEPEPKPQPKPAGSVKVGRVAA